MLQEVQTSSVKAQEFLRFASAKQREEIWNTAKALSGLRIVHINATSQGGGVAEILSALVPYLCSLGVEARWYALNPEQVPPGFFAFTNKLHNALQGLPSGLQEEEWIVYEKVSRKLAPYIAKLPYDVLVVHDPQPLLAGTYIKKHAPATLFIHIDTSHPQAKTWRKISSSVLAYDRTIFSNWDFVNQNLSKETLKVFEPAIDPLNLKQHIIPKRKARSFLAKYGIPEKGPLVVQVSRFDVWKNPFGVIEAFRRLQKKRPDAILALVGFQEAKDNPQAERMFQEVVVAANGNPRIHLFFDPASIGGGKGIREFTMMAQNAADVIVQNSTREGFGLTVTEAMWKGKPVVGGPASGIRRQITHKKTGYIAQDTKELEKWIRYALDNPAEAKAIGKEAKESVREQFLMPRLVLDHLVLYNELLS